MIIPSLHNTYLGRCIEKCPSPACCHFILFGTFSIKTRVCDILLEVKLASNRKNYVIYKKYAFLLFSMVGVTKFCS